MIWYKALFSWQGRLNRQGFWIGVAINFMFLLIVTNFWSHSSTFSVIYLVPLVIAVYSLCTIIIKRLHDRGRSGKAVIMAFVPIVCYGVSLSAQGTMAWLLGMMMPMFIGTMLFLEWGVFKGNLQANQYGEKGLSFRFK